MATIRHHVLIDAPGGESVPGAFPRRKESALGGTNKRPPKQIAASSWNTIRVRSMAW
jgi:hypothetical protein